MVIVREHFWRRLPFPQPILYCCSLFSTRVTWDSALRALLFFLCNATWMRNETVWGSKSSGAGQTKKGPCKIMDSLHIWGIWEHLCFALAMLRPGLQVWSQYQPTLRSWINHFPTPLFFPLDDGGDGDDTHLLNIKYVYILFWNQSPLGFWPACELDFSGSSPVPTGEDPAPPAASSRQLPPLPPSGVKLIRTDGVCGGGAPVLQSGVLCVSLSSS